MIPLSQFHRDYLTMQGVSLMPKSRVMQTPQQLFWHYPYQAERDFKALREKRTKFIEALRREGREAGLIR